MTYTKLIEELKEFKTKSWDGMPEENIDASIIIIDKMHRLQKIIVHSNLRWGVTKDMIVEELPKMPVNDIIDETWKLFSLIKDMNDIVMDESWRMCYDDETC